MRVQNGGWNFVVVPIGLCYVWSPNTSPSSDAVIKASPYFQSSPKLVAANGLAGVVHRRGGDSRSEDGRGGHGVTVTRRVTAGTRLRRPVLVLRLIAVTAESTPATTDSLARVRTTVIASTRLYTGHKTLHVYSNVTLLTLMCSSILLWFCILNLDSVNFTNLSVFKRNRSISNVSILVCSFNATRTRRQLIFTLLFFSRPSYRAIVCFMPFSYVPFMLCICIAILWYTMYFTLNGINKLTSASSMLVTEDALSCAACWVDDVADYSSWLALVTATTPAASARRLVITAVHVRAAALLGTELRLNRSDHRLITRTLAPLQVATHIHITRCVINSFVYIRLHSPLADLLWSTLIFLR